MSWLEKLPRILSNNPEALAGQEKLINPVLVASFMARFLDMAATSNDTTRTALLAHMAPPGQTIDLTSGITTAFMHETLNSVLKHGNFTNGILPTGIESGDMDILRRYFDVLMGIQKKLPDGPKQEAFYSKTGLSKTYLQIFRIALRNNAAHELKNANIYLEIDGLISSDSLTPAAKQLCEKYRYNPEFTAILLGGLTREALETKLNEFEALSKTKTYNDDYQHFRDKVLALYDECFQRQHEETRAGLSSQTKMLP